MDEVPIDHIRPSPYQPRLTFNLDDLRESIKKDGFLVPLTVRQKDGFYELIDGERRLRLAKELGYKTMPIMVIDVTDEVARRMVYKVNKERENYTPYEEAMFFKKLVEVEGMKPWNIETQVNVSHHWVMACLNVWKLPKDIQDNIFATAGLPLPYRIYLSDIFHLETEFLRNVEEATTILRQIIEKRMTADEKRSFIGKYQEKINHSTVEKALEKVEPEAKAPETPEELERASQVLKREAKKRREKALTPEEKARMEAEKSRKKEEKRKREQEKKKREEEELSKRLEAEKKRIEEEAKKKAKAELLGDTEFLKEASRRVPFILAEEKLEEMQVELPSELTEELSPSKPPLGEEVNKLNTLSGNEWIKFTKTWFTHNPPPRKLGEMLHPAKFPETLIAEFIEFFTKHGQIVLDPLLGTGSTLVACDMTGRIGIGVELEEKWAKIAKTRTKQTVILGDARDIDKMKIPKVDFVITSPPYWNQLKRANIRQKKRSDLGIPTEYREDTRNIGNIDDYNKFIEEQKRIFEKVYDLVKVGGYLVIITNNVFFEGKLYPLAFDTAISLSRNGRWVLKDEKIWLQDNKELLPLGIYNAWVGNRCHQYCLIFRKES